MTLHQVSEGLRGCRPWPVTVLVMQADAPFWDLLVFDGIDHVDVEAVTAVFGTVDIGTPTGCVTRSATMSSRTWVTRTPHSSLIASAPYCPRRALAVRGGCRGFDEVPLAWRGLAGPCLVHETAQLCPDGGGVQIPDRG